MEEKKTSDTFSHKLAKVVTAAWLVASVAVVALVCLVQPAASYLLAFYGIFSALPSTVIISYYTKAKAENLVKIPLDFDGIEEDM